MTAFHSSPVSRPLGGFVRLYASPAAAGTWTVALDVWPWSHNPMSGAVPLKDADPSKFSRTAGTNMQGAFDEVKKKIQQPGT